MNKEFFKLFLTNQINDKKQVLSKNELTEEDKALFTASLAELEALLSKLDETEEVDVLAEVKVLVDGITAKITAIEEKIKQNENIIEETMVEYLNSKNSLKDFADAVRNARNANEFKTNWNEYLSKNGITINEGSEDAYLPEAVQGIISDVWERNADWLADLNMTGAKRFYCRYNTNDQTVEVSRAKGHKAGTDKVSQQLNMGSKLLTGQFIYKIQELSYQTIWENDEALITYIVRELVDQILYEIKRAILVGDGRDASSDYKITSFEAIAKSASDEFTTVHTVTSGGFLVDDVRVMVDSIKNDNNRDIYLFLNKETLRTLSRVVASDTSSPIYISTEQVAEQLGVARIITTDILGETYKAVAMIPSEYYLVGENILNPVLYTWHEGYKNVDVWRYECVAGGGINAMKSTAVLKA